MAVGIPDEEKFSITSMYLTGNTKIWWRILVANPTSTQIKKWEALKSELKRKFLPSNTSWLVKEAVQRLKHKRSVRDYVKEFSSLMLDISEISKNDKLFNFMFGLQNWA